MFSAILKIAAFLGSIQTAIVWLGRFLRFLAQAVEALHRARRLRPSRVRVRK